MLQVLQYVLYREGAYRFSPNEIKELKEGRKSHNHLSWLGYCKPTFIRVREIIARV